MSYLNNFESLVLRHDYMRLCNNLDYDSIKKYAGVIRTTVSILFNKYGNDFLEVGMDIEDLTSVANMYAMYYVELYSLEKNESERIKLSQKKSGKDKDLERIDRNRLINFLRQKITYCRVLCKRKSSNISVSKEKNLVVAETKDSVDTNISNIADRHSILGYRLSSLKEYKEQKQISTKKGLKEVFDKDGYRLIKICVPYSKLIPENSMNRNDENYGSIWDVYINNSELSQPSAEEMLIEREEFSFIDKKRTEMASWDVSRKRRLLKTFVDNNKENERLKKEIALARKILKNRNYESLEL